MESEQARWPAYSNETRAYIDKMIETGEVFDYAGQNPVLELEAAFAELHGGLHAVTFNSGTSALFAALQAVGVGEGQDVLVPNLTFLASASPLLWIGANCILVDSESEEPSIGADAIRAAITPKTRAVIVTHLFGNPVDVSPIAQICRERGIALIEDCSHAHASFVGGRRVGTFGDAAIYSVGARKIVTGGHGGVLVTANERIRDIALMVGHFKPRSRTDIRSTDLSSYAEFSLGGNLRMSPLSAALALDHVRALEAWAEVRCENVQIYDDALEGLLAPVRSRSPRLNRSHFDLVYSLPFDADPALRERVISALLQDGIDASAPSTRPLNRVLRAIRPARLEIPLIQRVNRLAASAPSDREVPNSTDQHDRMISLASAPLHVRDARATREAATRVRDGVRRVLGGGA